MESNTAYSFTNHAPSTLWSSALFPAEPPASAQVLERLAEYLTPPHSHLSETRHRRQRVIGRSPDESTGWAYKACTEIIKEHSKSFYFSARLLPAGKQHSIMSLYAFCRLSDDLVDNADDCDDREAAREKANIALTAWADQNRGNNYSIHNGSHDSHNPVVIAWADTRARFSIPSQLVDDLLSGIRMDLTISRYDTWDELWLYSYRVASTVGLMSMYITGAETMQAVPYAVQLGIALQLTNILRDVGEDARVGRIYLPAEDMERFGYTEDMLLDGVLNRQFVELMKFEVARATALYRSAYPGVAMLPRDSRLAVSAAANVYRGILGKIEAAKYDVFNRRAHLSMGEKVRALPRIWLEQKRATSKRQREI
ncbi:MAG: phytoene/squalene synthase family protein [Chloroflexota bacterium]|nr:phytoene/squalene synthase family protein [Chloroflexota bacterium]